MICPVCQKSFIPKGKYSGIYHNDDTHLLHYNGGNFLKITLLDEKKQMEYAISQSEFTGRGFGIRITDNSRQIHREVYEYRRSAEELLLLLNRIVSLQAFL